MIQLRSARDARVVVFPPPEISLLLTPVVEEPNWFELAAVPLLDGVAVVFAEGAVVDVTTFFTSFAACSAWAAAVGSVRTKVAVLAFGTAFCVASFASCGVTPMAVVGTVAVTAFWAHTPTAVNANVAHTTQFFIEQFDMARFFPEGLKKHLEISHDSRKQCHPFTTAVLHFAVKEYS